MGLLFGIPLFSITFVKIWSLPASIIDTVNLFSPPTSQFFSSTESEFLITPVANANETSDSSFFDDVDDDATSA